VLFEKSAKLVFWSKVAGKNMILTLEALGIRGADLKREFCYKPKDKDKG